MDHRPSAAGLGGSVSRRVVKGPNWTPPKKRRPTRRVRTIRLPVRLDPEHVFRLAITPKLRADLATLNDDDRLTLMAAVVAASREQQISGCRRVVGCTA